MYRAISSLQDATHAREAVTVHSSSARAANWEDFLQRFEEKLNEVVQQIRRNLTESRKMGGPNCVVGSRHSFTRGPCLVHRL